MSCLCESGATPPPKKWCTRSWKGRDSSCNDAWQGTDDGYRFCRSPDSDDDWRRRTRLSSARRRHSTIWPYCPAQSAVQKCGAGGPSSLPLKLASTVLCNPPQSSTILHNPPQSSTILHNPPQSSTILHNPPQNAMKHCPVTATRPLQQPQQRGCQTRPLFSRARTGTGRLGTGNDCTHRTTACHPHCNDPLVTTAICPQNVVRESTPTALHRTGTHRTTTPPGASSAQQRSASSRWGKTGPRMPDAGGKCCTERERRRSSSSSMRGQNTGERWSIRGTLGSGQSQKTRCSEPPHICWGADRTWQCRGHTDAAPLQVT